MHCQGRSARQRRTLIVRIDALFIQRVPGLVHGAEQRGNRVLLLIASRDADVVHTERGLERMWGLILTAAAPVISKFGNDIHTEIHQLLLFVFPVKKSVFYLFAGGNGL